MLNPCTAHLTGKSTLQVVHVQSHNKGLDRPRHAKLVNLFILGFILGFFPRCVVIIIFCATADCLQRAPLHCWLAVRYLRCEPWRSEHRTYTCPESLLYHAAGLARPHTCLHGWRYRCLPATGRPRRRVYRNTDRTQAADVGSIIS